MAIELKEVETLPGDVNSKTMPVTPNEITSPLFQVDESQGISRGEAASTTPSTNDNGNVVDAKTATSSTSGSSSGTTNANTSSVPAAATAGMDFKTIQQSLNTTYDSKYDAQLQDLYNKIVQRQPFSYSADDDMLYQNYLQKYTQQGKQAMRDTMGQAAALTGGYGSSYGQAVGQQQYDAYLQNLNDILPELYNMAYQRYQDEGDRLTQQYGLLGDLDDRALSRWQANYNVNADNYDRYMEEAALAGAAGDFSKYEDVFGADSVDKMEALFNAQTLMELYKSGYLSAEQYMTLTGEYPVGYRKGGSSGGGVNYYGGGSSGGNEDGAPMTRGSVARAAESAHSSGSISLSQYNDIISSLH